MSEPEGPGLDEVLEGLMGPGRRVPVTEMARPVGKRNLAVTQAAYSHMGHGPREIDRGAFR